MRITTSTATGTAAPYLHGVTLLLLRAAMTVLIATQNTGGAPQVAFPGRDQMLLTVMVSTPRGNWIDLPIVGPALTC